MAQVFAPKTKQIGKLSEKEKAFVYTLRKLGVEEYKISAFIGYTRLLEERAGKKILTTEICKIPFKNVKEGGRERIMKEFWKFSKDIEKKTGMHLILGASELKQGKFSIVAVPVAPISPSIGVSKYEVVTGKPTVKGWAKGPVIDWRAVGRLAYTGGDIAMSAILISPISIYEGGKYIKEGMKNGAPLAVMGGFAIAGLEFVSPGFAFDWAAKPAQKAIRKGIGKGIQKKISKRAQYAVKKIIEKSLRKKLTKLGRTEGARAFSEGLLSYTDASSLCNDVITQIESKLRRGLRFGEKSEVVSSILDTVKASDEVVEVVSERVLGKQGPKEVLKRIKEVRMAVKVRPVLIRAGERIKWYFKRGKGIIDEMAKKNPTLKAYAEKPLRNIKQDDAIKLLKENFVVKQARSGDWQIRGFKYKDRIYRFGDINTGDIKLDSILKRPPIIHAGEKVIEKRVLHVFHPQITRRLNALGLPIAEGDSALLRILVHGDKKAVNTVLDEFSKYVRIF